METWAWKSSFTYRGTHSNLFNFQNWDCVAGSLCVSMPCVESCPCLCSHSYHINDCQSWMVMYLYPSNDKRFQDIAGYLNCTQNTSCSPWRLPDLSSRWQIASETGNLECYDQILRWTFMTNEVFQPGGPPASQDELLWHWLHPVMRDCTTGSTAEQREVTPG